MKAFTLYLLLLSLLYACAQVSSESEGKIEKSEVKPDFPNKQINSIAGVWGLTEMITIQGGDTTVVSEDIGQYKVYTQRHYMWTREVPVDSAALHGFGTYELIGDTLIETPMSSSIVMQELMKQNGMQEFKIGIQLGRDQYTQTIYDAEANEYTIEKYQRIDSQSSH